MLVGTNTYIPNLTEHTDGKQIGTVCTGMIQILCDPKII